MDSLGVVYSVPSPEFASTKERKSSVSNSFMDELMVSVPFINWIKFCEATNLTFQNFRL